jgi:hypothetical protein
LTELGERRRTAFSSVPTRRPLSAAFDRTGLGLVEILKMLRLAVQQLCRESSLNRFAPSAIPFPKNQPRAGSLP